MPDHSASSTIEARNDEPVPSGGEDSAAVTSWLLCCVGSHRFALPLPSVIETMRMLPIEAVAGAPALVRGLCIIRGAPTPVVDAAQLFDGEARACERLVTARTGRRIVAFAIDSVLGIQDFPADRKQQLPPLLRDVDSITSIAALDDELVFFLQLARILPADFRDGSEEREVDL
jgi:purine-binding chemotaxis protein CheW